MCASYASGLLSGAQHGSCYCDVTPITGCHDRYVTQTWDNNSDLGNRIHTVTWKNSLELDINSLALPPSLTTGTYSGPRPTWRLGPVAVPVISFCRNNQAYVNFAVNNPYCHVVYLHYRHKGFKGFMFEMR